MINTLSRTATTDRTHVISKNGRWAVKKEGASRATKVYDEKRSAVTGAVRSASKGSDVVVHKRDGSVERWIKK